jgi:hypothetical protein
MADKVSFFFSSKISKLQIAAYVLVRISGGAQSAMGQSRRYGRAGLKIGSPRRRMTASSPKCQMLRI